MPPNMPFKRRDIAFTVDFDGCKCLCAVICKFSLDDEGEQKILPVVKPVSGIKPVHFRSEGDGFCKRRTDEVEKRVSELGTVCVSAFYIGNDVCHIDRLGQYSFVVGAVRQDVR